MLHLPTSSKTTPCIILFVIQAVFVVFFGFLAIAKFNNFQYNGLDLAIIHQVFHNSSVGNFFQSTIHPPTYLKDHFSPILFILLPLYLIKKSASTILILQIIATVVASWPIYLIAKKYFSQGVSLLVSCAWLFNPMVQNLMLFEFSFLPFALAFLFFAFYYFKKNIFWAFILFAVLALFVREDIALIIFMFGALAMLEKKKKIWIFAPIILAVLYFFFSMRIINFFNGNEGYKFFIYYSWLGNTWLEAVKYLVFHPWIIIIRLLSIGNIEMVLGFLLPFAFVSLLRPRYLILSLLPYAQILLGSAGPSGLVLKTQYSALFLPSLFLAFIASLKALQTMQPKNPLIKIFFKEHLGQIILIVAVVYSSLTLGPVIGVVQKDIFGTDKKMNSHKTLLIKKIPVDAAVAVSYDMLSSVSGRERVYGFNYFFIGTEQFGKKEYVLPSDTEYLLMNLSDFVTYEIQYRDSPLYKNTFASGSSRVRQRIEQDGFIVTDVLDDIVLFSKNTAAKITLYEVVKNTPQDINSQESAHIGDSLDFLGWKMNTIQNQTTPLELFWKTKQNIHDNYFIKIFFTNKEKERIYEKIYPMGSGIYPASEWKKNAIIRTNYWPYIPEKHASINMDMYLEVFAIDKGGVYLDSDLSTKNSITLQTMLSRPIFIKSIKPYNNGASSSGTKMLL